MRSNPCRYPKLWAVGVTNNPSSGANGYVYKHVHVNDLVVISLARSSCAFLFPLLRETDDDCSFSYLRSSADAGYHAMSSLTPPNQPSLPWRIGSSLTIGAVGAFCRTFLYGFNDSQVVGLDRFLKVLEERRDVGARTRGLLTGTVFGVTPPPRYW